MFPIKRFVQGPSLHDEVISYEEKRDKRSVNQGKLSGEEVSKVYEEIINLPSTAAATSSSSSSNASNSNTPTPHSSAYKRKKTSAEEVKKKDVPKISRLMTFCESDDHTNLEENLKTYKEEIDIDAVDEYGWTLLMSASCAGAAGCVSILLQNGANWTIEDKKGLTAFEIAVKNRRSAVCDLLQEWNTCFLERVERMQMEQTQSEDNRAEIEGNEAGSSKRYCEICQIVYESSKDMHEKSIAHLVCTAQFGKDKIHFGIPESNKGFQLMVKSGWDQNSGLGPDGTGHKFPVKTVLKRNKLGLGNEKERKAARITHFGPFDSAAVEAPLHRIEREVTVRRREANKTRTKEKRKEINFRREFVSL